jgi:hypothetical protein
VIEFTVSEVCQNHWPPSVTNRHNAIAHKSLRLLPSDSMTSSQHAAESHVGTYSISTPRHEPGWTVAGNGFDYP